MMTGVVGGLGQMHPDEPLTGFPLVAICAVGRALLLLSHVPVIRKRGDLAPAPRHDSGDAADSKERKGKKLTSFILSPCFPSPDPSGILYFPTSFTFLLDGTLARPRVDAESLSKRVPETGDRSVGAVASPPPPPAPLNSNPRPPHHQPTRTQRITDGEFGQQQQSTLPPAAHSDGRLHHPWGHGDDELRSTKMQAPLCAAAYVAVSK